jgi:hypothetical protein
VAKLLCVNEEDVQTLVRTDERADESAIVVCGYAKSAAEDALEVLNGLGVSHQKVCLCDEPVREQRRLEHARPTHILEYPQVLRHPANLQRAQELAHHHMATRQGVY